MPILAFECQHRYAGGFELDVSFEINHRFTTLFGPSGSGKTSILSVVTGALRPSQGVVRMGDRMLLDTNRAICLPPSQRNLGMVFQDALLFPHMTVERNLKYGQRHRHTSRRPIQFARVIEVLELGDLLRRYPCGLSGGERQRVALGRAILSSPELLIMDEPLVSLDDSLKGRILAYLERMIAEWNIPTLFVTHNQAEVRRAADWVVVINKGRVIGAGLPNDALSQPDPLAWTNSAGPVNLLRIERIIETGGLLIAHAAGQHIFLPINTLPSPPPAFAQFRPADVILSRGDVSGLSVRNHFGGQVVHVRNVENSVFVAVDVDVGQVIWAEITPQAADELQLSPGVGVICLLKSHCVTLVN